MMPSSNDVPMEPTGQTVEAGQLPAPATTQQVPVPQYIDVPAIAEDSDLIEDEWVNAVKKIMHHNQTDPYIQTQAFIMLKADYMKKRYGRDIKLSE